MHVQVVSTESPKAQACQRESMSVASPEHHVLPACMLKMQTCRDSSLCGFNHDPKSDMDGVFHVTLE